MPYSGLSEHGGSPQSDPHDQSGTSTGKHVRTLLSEDQRQRIDEVLKQLGVGDAIDRSLFLASLDYQLASFTMRLQSVDRGRETAILQHACNLAADSVEEPGKGQLRALCESFLSELACAYDACFEKPPTPDLQGPFGRLLGNLCDCLSLPLQWDTEMLHRAIAAGGLR